MSVIKNETANTLEVRTRYTDWTGARKQKTKRGFIRKADAVEWEQNFQLKASQNVDMTFGDFVDTYIEDMKPRLRENTAPDIVAWQNEIMRHKDAHETINRNNYILKRSVLITGCECP